MGKKIILVLLMVSIVFSIFFLGCTEKQQTNINDQATEPQKVETKPTQIANPASMYCKKQGGELEIRTNPDGNQAGYCIFPDGSECEEWAYFRSECEPGETK